MTEESLNAAQLAINLRKSHFTLGNFPRKQYKSIMRKDYIPHPLEDHMSFGKELNLRGAHFELGNYEGKNFYATTNNAKYHEHYGFRPEKLNEEKKEDLRTHHFTLGKSGPTNISYSRIAYPKREIPTNLKDEQDFQRNKMRKHHHNFEETKQKMMTTHYNSEFNKDFPPDYLKQGRTKEELMQRVVELRNSHIIFGKENVPYKTVQNTSYNPKSLNSLDRAPNPGLMRTNFRFGDTKTDYQTINQEFLVEQPYSKNTIAADTMRELRETHFVLGGGTNNFNSVQAVSFQKPELGKQELKNMSPFLYQNHFALGDPNCPTNYSSTYQRNMKPYEVNKENSLRGQNADRGSNFVIGKQNVDYRSESSAKYKIPQNVVKATLDEKLQKDLRSSHFKFNDIKDNKFITTAQKSYPVRNGETINMDEQLKKNLRSTHYSLGKTDGVYSTEYYTKYTKKDMPQNINMRELSSQLRSTHFKLG